MQIILLANDEASKLHPLTTAIPSPLIPIVNRPVIGLTMEILARTGFRQVIVSLCNRAGAIASYLGNGGRWGMSIRYALQREPLGTAGAIRWAAQHLHETVLILPADAILDLDIEAAVAYHQAHGQPATLILHERDGAPSPQPIWIDVDGRVLPSGAEQGAGQPMWHTGAYILEPHAVQQIPAQAPCDAYTQYIPALASSGIARGYVAREYWNSLHSFAYYQEAQCVFLYSAYDPGVDRDVTVRPDIPRVRFAVIEGHQIAPGIWVEHNHVIHPEARLAAPVCIGAGSQIGRGADLGPEAVIGSHVIVDDDATITHSVVLDATYVGKLVSAEGRTIHQTMMIDMHSGHMTIVVDPFLLAELPVRPRFSAVRRLVSRFSALLLLTLLLPVLTLLAIAVGLTSGPRALVAQTRVGRRATNREALEGGTPDTFELLGFRTRRASGSYTLLGRWLEHWEFNHLPAIWNVVRGDLDLIGIKPLLPHEAATIIEDWQQQRNMCAAGLLGLWLVQEGCNDDLDSTLVADAYYVATQSWKTDVRILVQVPRSWLRRVRQPLNRAEFALGPMQERII